MGAIKIKDNVCYVGTLDPDRKLFDDLIPLPYGTTYNSYIIRGSQATALIDSSDPSKLDELLENIADTGIKKIDYLISQHAEQDHSGLTGMVMERYPDIQLVTNKKCSGMIEDLLDIEADRFMIVEDGDTLSLGDKTLEFIFTPWVHWPETMSTYIREDKLLFSCDFFGSHYSFKKVMFSQNDAGKIMSAAKRYYGEIMLPFGNVISKNMDKLRSFEIDMIAPSHGPVYDDIAPVTDAYREWSSGKLANTVAIPYVSMHGSTEKMVEYLKDSLEKKDIKAIDFHLTEDDLGEYAATLIDAATVVIATPTVLSGPHPQAVYAAFFTRYSRPPVKFLSIIGSYGWGGRTVEILEDVMSPMKAEMLEPVLIKGAPSDEDLKALDVLAGRIKESHDKISDQLK